MFEKACKKLSEWNGSEFTDISISCNFTRSTISEEDFIAKLTEITSRYSFDKPKLMIEITEDSIEKNLDIAIKNILWAKEFGFSIALDDIGSGYTSLVNLCEYPIDVVKMDRKILLIANEENGKKLFLGIVSLAHYLNLTVVCEGVETEEQNALVFDSDCYFIQGWYYSQGLSEDKAEAFALDYINKA
jgi:EAL domain-containing protein (putative c-di-GMP-specific phosphodiesterase class I)